MVLNGPMVHVASHCFVLLRIQVGSRSLDAAFAAQDGFTLRAGCMFFCFSLTHMQIVVHFADVADKGCFNV